MNIITSKSNQVLKKAKKLQSKKYRTESYLIEGWHLYEEAVKAKAPIQAIFLVDDQEGLSHDGAALYQLPQALLADLADSKSPQGIVAQIKIEEQAFPDLSKGKYLFLEDVQDPGNLGTMVRTAHAAGYDAVFLSDKSADLYNMKTLRSMQGSHFHLPIYRLETEKLVTLAKEAGLMILASNLDKTSKDYRELAGQESFLLVMGNEGRGISQEMTDWADHLVHIPMPGSAESLNVAVAAGILMFGL